MNFPFKLAILRIIKVKNLMYLVMNMKKLFKLIIKIMRICLIILNKDCHIMKRNKRIFLQFLKKKKKKKKLILLKSQKLMKIIL